LNCYRSTSVSFLFNFWPPLLITLWLGVFTMFEKPPVEVTSTLKEKVPPPAVTGTVVDASSVEPRFSPYLLDSELL
jgi:hypothetical protein